jgi:hypothetical protein
MIIFNAPRQFPLTSCRIKHTYEIVNKIRVIAARPNRSGHTSIRLCENGRYPLMAPTIWDMVTAFTALTDGFRIVLTASVYR